MSGYCVRMCVDLYRAPRLHRKHNTCCNRWVGELDALPALRQQREDIRNRDPFDEY